MPVDGRPCEPGKTGQLRNVRPHTVADLSLKSSAQAGQFWSRHGDQWWMSHSHDSHVDEDYEGGADFQGDGAEDDGHGGVVPK